MSPPGNESGKPDSKGINTTFQQAAALHRHGRLTDAAHLYEAILRDAPNHFGALHGLGVYALQCEQPQRSVEFIGRAISVDPYIASAHYNIANAYRALSRSGDAAASYDRAIALKPDFAEAHCNRGLVLRSLDRPEEALASYDRAIAVKPDFAEACYNRALVLADLQRSDDALASYDSAIAMRPDFAEAHSDRGNALRALMRPKEALASYDRAIALNPDFAAAYSNRGLALQDLNRLEEALASYDRAIALKPDFAEAYSDRGLALQDLMRPKDALASYDKAIALRPKFAEAYSNRGNALRDLKRPEDALASYDKAIALRPHYPEAYYNRGLALGALRRPEDALASYDKAIAFRPNYAEAYSNRGNALGELNRPEDALASYERAIAIKPDFADAYDNKGVLLTQLGRFGEANNAIERAIAIAPRRVRSYFNLTQSKRLTPGDPHIQAMKELTRDRSLLSIDEQVDLDFALAKAFADIGDNTRSFQRLLDGAALKRRELAYDEAASLSAFERTRTVFTSEFMRRGEGLGDPSDLPVFIVGMPRSGTTLVEQILASHPNVFAAGETEEFAGIVAAIGGNAGEMRSFPAVIPLMSGQQLRELGASYLSRVGVAVPSAERITDKTPDNFRFIGLIHLTLPNARIIHTGRSAIDTCLSCFSKRFVGDNVPYSYDLAELARYYRAYEALIAHWRAVMPPNIMIDVQYEDVITDLEGQARRIVAHCGLPWDPRCLDFHLTERSVRTASATQVRQPIYKNSVGRWRAFEPFLKPLMDGLQASIAPPNS